MKPMKKHTSNTLNKKISAGPRIKQVYEKRKKPVYIPQQHKIRYGCAHCNIERAQASSLEPTALSQPRPIYKATYRLRLTKILHRDKNQLSYCKVIKINNHDIFTQIQKFLRI